MHPFLLRYAHLLQDWDNRANKTVLVPLCGKSDDLFWLAQAAGLKRVIGIESSSVAIKSLLKDYEYTRITENIECYSTLAGKITIYCGDLFDDNMNPALLGGPVDYIWDRAAIVALHWKDHERYVSKLLSFQGTPVGKGKYDWLIGAYWHTQHRGPPFDVDLAHLRHIFGQKLNVEQLDEIDAFYSGWQNGGFHGHGRALAWCGTTHCGIRNRAQTLIRVFDYDTIFPVNFSVSLYFPINFTKQKADNREIVVAARFIHV